MKRIKVVNSNPNPLFMKWLEEWRQMAMAQNKPDFAMKFKLAMNSLEKYPIVLKNGQECSVMNHFGTGLCRMIDKQIRKYKDLNIWPEPVNEPDPTTPPKRQHVEEKTAIKAKKTKKITSPKEDIIKDDKETEKQIRQYIPERGTVGYSLLYIIYKYSLKEDYPGYMLKKDIIYHASKDDDSPVKRRAVGSSGNWIMMSRLIKENLVASTNSPARFSLTPAGEALASTLFCQLLENKSNNTNRQGNPEQIHYPKQTSPHPQNNDVREINDSDNDSNVSDFEDFCRENEEPVLHVRKPISQSIVKELFHVPSASKECMKDVHELFPQKKKGSPIKTKTINKISKDKNVVEKKKKACTEIPADSFFLLPNNFDIILLVDTQETSGHKAKISDDLTKSELLALKVNFEVRSLSVGDFLWIARCRLTERELVLPYIIERKRLDDLSSSIKDGRYKEQKYRLKQSGIKNIIYLIESYDKNIYGSLPLESLLQAGVNSLVQDKFNVSYTSSHKESMHYLSHRTKLLNKIYEGKELWSCKKQNIEYSDIDILQDRVRLMEFLEFNKSSVKTKNFTVQELFIKQLMQLKGISATRAVRIAELYPTPKCLQESFLREGEHLLTDVKVDSSKIGASISQTLYKFYTTVDF